MTKVFALLPPTTGGLTQNVTDHSLSSTTANLFDAKIDHAFSDKHRISGGFDYDNTRTGGTSSLSPIFGSSTPQNTRYARFSDNYIFSPTVVNQFLFGFSRRYRAEGSNSIGQGFPAKIGLTGVNNTTFPCFKFFGGSYREVLNNCGDSEFADNVYQINDSVSWVKGKHNLKFGGGVRMDFGGPSTGSRARSRSSVSGLGLSGASLDDLLLVDGGAGGPHHRSAGLVVVFRAARVVAGGILPGPLANS